MSANQELNFALTGISFRCHRSKTSPLSFYSSLEEMTGIAVTLARNKSRSLEVIGKKPGKKHGSQRRHFKAKELGSSEAEKDKVLPIDVKYFNDGLLKLIKDAKRHFLCLCGDKSFSNQSNHFCGVSCNG
ncbi:hypothetical protein BDF21DRAFT_395682 [Thamnidium elegans]|nr:hypothetical protein BDF21DRAFT_395682 [Thamnidium elegans]